MKMLDILLSFSANFDDPDRDGLTPLYYAIEHCGLDMVKRLIELGSNLHIKDKQGRQPIYYAASMG